MPNHRGQAGVRYHTWFIEVNGTDELAVSAIAGVPCPELDGEVLLLTC